MGGRPWDAIDLAFLRKVYGTMTVQELANAFERSKSSVWQRAVIEGVAKRTPRVTRLDQAKIRKLAAKGWCNRCIGRKVKHNRSHIRNWRRKLGLPAIAAKGMTDCPVCKEKIRATTKEQCRKAGVKCLAEIKRIAVAKFAVEHGWPSQLPPRCVQILELLAVHGPLTRRMLWEMMGFHWTVSRKAFRGRKGLLGGTCMTHLMHLGLVVSLGRPVQSRPVRQGHNVGLYSLTQLAIDMHREHHERNQRNLAGKNQAAHADAG